MLTIEEYKIRYPKEKGYGSWDGSFNPGAILIAEGYLQFNEGANNWAGPWEGNYARFVLVDFTNATITYGKDKGGSYLDYQAKRRRENYERDARRAAFNNKPIHKWTEEPVGGLLGYPSKQFPVRLWMCGNDDTSYSKTYKTKKDALNELNLFIQNEPLEFKIVYDFNFIFTN